MRESAVLRKPKLFLEGVISFAKQASVRERKPRDHSQAVQDRIDTFGGGCELLCCLARTLNGPHILNEEITNPRQKLGGEEMHHMSMSFYAL